jgi:DNA-directed RNA polymerase sigma subunit (sigma70/sigma32)
MQTMVPKERGPSGDSPSERGEIAQLSAQVRAFRPLSAAERTELLGAVERGDPMASQRLVEHHLTWVLDAAQRYRARGLDFGDLFQAGCEGLIAMVDHYRGAERDFQAACERAIAHAIEVALAEEAGARRNDEAFIESCNAMESAELLLKAQLHREVSDAEIARVLQWDEARVATVRALRVEALRRHDLELVPFLDARDEDPRAAGS